MWLSVSIMDKEKIIAEAERGFDYAQFDLGCMYLHGNGVPQNLVEAVKWLRRSAEQGYSHAQSKLGVVYECLLVPASFGLERDAGFLASSF